jgi:glycosyltransferase involved in cell wall biosynthesis
MLEHKDAKRHNFLVAFVSAYPPDIGRLSEYAKEFISSLASRIKVDREILVLSDSIQHCESNIIVKAAWRPNSIMGIIRLYINILKTKCRLIHFNLHLAVFGSSRVINFLGLLSPLIARLSGKKVIVTLHNIPDAIGLEETKLRNSLMNRLGLLLVMKILISSANLLVVTVKKYVLILKKRYRAKNIRFIPHGAWFTNHQNKWNIDSPLNLLFIGYLAPYKDLRRLVEIVDTLRRENPGIKLLISGAAHPNYPDYKDIFLNNISGKHYIKYLGRVPNEEIPELVSKSRVLILPYKTSTGTSGVYHLVAGLGLPVIAPPTIEFKEIVEEGGGIVMLDLWSKDAAQNILKILLNKELLSKLSRKNVEYALKRSWDVIAEEYLKLYREVLVCEKKLY